MFCAQTVDCIEGPESICDWGVGPEPGWGGSQGSALVSVPAPVPVAIVVTSRSIQLISERHRGNFSHP